MTNPTNVEWANAQASLIEAAQAEGLTLAQARTKVLGTPPTNVDTGISDLQHAVDAIVREDNLSRASAFELIAERGLDSFAATILAEKARFVAGVEIERQLKDASSDVSRRQLGLAQAAHDAKVRSDATDARGLLNAERATNGLLPEDVEALSDLDALSAAGYAVPQAPQTPVVDVTKHPAYLENAAAIAKLEAATAGKEGA